MASIRLVIFLFAVVYLCFFNDQGRVADGKSYLFSTQVGRDQMQREIVRKMGRIIVKKQGGRHSSQSTIDHSFDNFYKRKNENLSVKYKLISKSDNSHGGHLLGSKGSRFIAFNADYFVAKPHPPKNNGGKCL